MKGGAEMQISGEHAIARQVRNIAVDDWMNRCEEQAVRAITAEQKLAEAIGELGAANEKIAALEATISEMRGRDTMPENPAQ